jgi:hypothetical protein
MALLVRNDEQIQVGVTPGLVAGASSFTFDGTDGKPDYRGTEIVISELTGRGILVHDLDFSWEQSTGYFQLLQEGDVFMNKTYYNVHFQPVPQPISEDHYSFINSAFFIRNINLTNLNVPEVIDRLNYFITKYEPECLENILGYELYTLLLSESSQRMLDLSYGVEYIDNYGRLFKWKGLVHGANISLIANYIYFYFQEANALQTTGTGTKSTKAEAGMSEAPHDKMLHAWRFFASETRNMAYFLWYSTDALTGLRLYPEFSSDQYYRTNYLARAGGVNRMF